MSPPRVRSPWIVVADFDGTLTNQDVGNELCKEFIPELFFELHRAYRRRELTLREMQPRMWSRFPCDEATFRRRSAELGTLRKGAEAFLAACADRKLPVYVASCGLRPYIESVLEARLDSRVRGNIAEIRCNEAEFGPTSLIRFSAPDDDPASPYPLDKGAWCRELRARLKVVDGREPKILGLGNGTSDRTFVGQVDLLAATDGLRSYLESQGESFVAFSSLDELLSLEPFRD